MGKCREEEKRMEEVEGGKKGLRKWREEEKRNGKVERRRRRKRW